MLSGGILQRNGPIRITIGVAALLLGASLEASAQGPAHNVGAKECAECHGSEVKVWKETEHYTHARTLTRNPKAKTIAKAMGVRRMKSDDQCTTCHFTMTQKPGRKPRASSGVSCESCHGSARDWIDVHGNYGGPNVTRRNEAASHRKKRIEASDRAGMHRVADLYDLTAACYSCHVIDDEQLINKGGHPTGERFDFVTYTQGEMRHNFLRGTRSENELSEGNRRQQMYVVSRMLELEHGLRALAEATVLGAYLDEQAKRIRETLRELETIATRTRSAEIPGVIQIAKTVRLAPRQRKAALAAADRVRDMGRALARPNRARELAGVRDPLAPRTSRTKR